MSTLAVFIALGGTSYAAATLKRNSVGSAQIKDRSILLRALSLSARGSLKGKQGPQGPAGPEAIRYFVVANAAGAFLYGDAKGGVQARLGATP